jgi:hypothetical protein
MFNFYIKSVNKGENLEGAAIFDRLRQMKAFEYSDVKVATMVPAAEAEFDKAIEYAFFFKIHSSIMIYSSFLLKSTLDKIEQIRRDKMINDSVSKEKGNTL